MILPSIEFSLLASRHRIFPDWWEDFIARFLSLNLANHELWTKKFTNQRVSIAFKKNISCVSSVSPSSFLYVYVCSTYKNAASLWKWERKCVIQIIKTTLRIFKDRLKENDDEAIGYGVKRKKKGKLIWKSDESNQGLCDERTRVWSVGVNCIPTQKINKTCRIQ